MYRQREMQIQIYRERDSGRDGEIYSDRQGGDSGRDREGQIDMEGDGYRAGDSKRQRGVIVGRYGERDRDRERVRDKKGERGEYIDGARYIFIGIKREISR